MIRLLALAALGAGYAMLLTTASGLAWDDGLYLVLGKALATGHGYRVISLPGAPFEAAHPPLYALLLAGVWALVPGYPGNLWALKGLNVALALLVVAASYALARLAYERPRPQALAVAALVATSSAVLVFLDFTMSELAYMAASTAALVAMERLLERSPALTPRLVVGLAFLATLPAMVRTLGVTLALGAALLLLARRQWLPLAGFLAATALCHLPWQLWTWYLVHSNQPLLMDYMGWIGRATGPEKLNALLATAYVNARAIAVEHLPALLAPAYATLAHARTGAWLAPLAWLALVGSCAWGLAIAARPRPRLIHAYALAYLALIIPFPWPPERYLAGLAPVLLFGLVEGAWALGARRSGRLLAACLLAGSMAWGAGTLARHLVHPGFAVANAGRPDASLGEVPVATVRALAARMEPDAVLMDRNDFLAYLLTGHEAFRSYQVSPFAAAAFPDINARVGARPVYAIAPEMPGWHAVTPPGPDGLGLFRR